jgi:hypothetical protein
MPRHRLIHRVVDHLGEQVMQSLLIGAADVHARPAAHGLEPLQHLDVGGRVAVGGFGAFADGAGHGFCFYLLRFCRRNGDRAALHQREASLRRWGAFCALHALVIGFAEQVAQGPETEGWHGFLSPR